MTNPLKSSEARANAARDVRVASLAPAAIPGAPQGPAPVTTWRSALHPPARRCSRRTFLGAAAACPVLLCSLAPLAPSRGAAAGRGGGEPFWDDGSDWV